MESRKRINLQEESKNIFYALPKTLFTDPTMNNLRVVDKVTYSILRDRQNLSAKNKWKDKDGNVFVLLTRKTIGKWINHDRNTISKSISRLKESDLIIDKYRGQNLCNQILVKNIQFDSFYALPKFLYMLDEFSELSNNAKLLYSIIKDKMGLSIAYNHVNDNGELFAIIKRTEMQEALKLSDKPIIEAIKELKEYDLLDEESYGFGKNKQSQLYLKNVNFEKLSYKKEFQTNLLEEVKLEQENKIDKGLESLLISSGYEKIDDNPVKSTYTEFFSTQQNQHTRSFSAPIHGVFQHPYTEFFSMNKTDLNKTIYNTPSPSPSLDLSLHNNKDKDYSKIKEHSLIKKINKQIQTDKLLNLFDKKIVYAIRLSIMNILTMDNKEEHIRINGKNQKVKFLKNIFKKVSFKHIFYILNEIELPDHKDYIPILFTTIIEMELLNKNNKEIENDISLFDKYVELVKEQISYKDLEVNNYEEIDLVNEIILIMADVYTSKEEYILIDGNPKNIESIKSVYNRVNQEIIFRIIFKYNKIREKITYKKRYMRVLIYNTVLEDNLDKTNTIAYRYLM